MIDTIRSIIFIMSHNEGNIMEHGRNGHTVMYLPSVLVCVTGTAAWR